MGSVCRIARGCARWCLGIVLTFGLLAATAPPVQAQQCTGVACVSAGPRLVSVNTAQSALLNPLFQALLPGTAVNLSVLDWNALAGADINLNALLTELNGGVVVSDPSQVLNADITLAQLQLAMVNVLQADGNTAAANALQLLPLNAPGLTGTIKLADLLQISLPQGALADIDLDVLDLITGGVQLYNFENVLTTPQPVTISTAALNDLGLAGTLANLQLWMQVVEPPIYVCGPEGTAFHTSAIRIKLNTDLVQELNLTTLTNALNGLNLAGLATVSDASITADVLKLQLYADVARAEGTISGIDLVTSAVTLNARPGLTNVYVGTIADAIFFNRSHVVTGADVAPTVLTNLNVSVGVNVLGLNVATVLVPVAVQVRATAQGSPTLQSLTFNPAYPQTKTLTCGTSCAGDLAADLLTSLDVKAISGDPVLVAGTLPIGLPLATVANLVTANLESTLDVMVPTLLQPVFDALLGLVDDLLGLLGIAIGQAVFTVEGMAQSCAAALQLMKVLDPVSNPGLFNLSVSQGATVLASANDVGNNGTTATVVTTPGATYDLAETAGTNTTLAPYISTWACTDQASNPVSSGSGTSFTLTAPAATTTAVTITCRITNRARQANLSISKSDGSSTYTPGTTASYVITVSNAGPDAVTGALVNDTLPGGVTLTGPWTCTATNGTCTPGSGGTAGGQAISLSVDLQAGGQAQITVPVSFAADPADYP